MDTTKTDAPAENDEQSVEDGAVNAAEGGGEPGPTPVPEIGAVDALDEDAAEAELAELSAARATRSVVVSGAAGLVGLGLALASLSGTWLGSIMSQREQLIGQIAAQSHPGANQIVLQFGTPWHTLELFNGFFALIGAVVAAIVLIAQTGAERPASATVPWIRAVAWGALVLGLIGLVVAGVMYFDVFTALPHLPATPAAGAPTG